MGPVIQGNLDLIISTYCRSPAATTHVKWKFRPYNFY